MSSTEISVTDTRGNPITIPASTIRHAEPHFDYDPVTTQEAVVKTCESPEAILANHGNARNPRKGHERYYKKYGDRYTTVAIEIVEGNQRRALTCYTSENIPAEKRIWTGKM